MKDIISERLRLSQWKEEEAAYLYEYAKNPNVGPHAGWDPHKDVAESKKIIKEIFSPIEAWSIRIQGEEIPVGTIGLENDIIHVDQKSKELGYSLMEECWGKGIMTEAALAVLDFAFSEMDLELVGIQTSDINKRSQRVIEKCGFTYEKNIDNKRIYSMTKEQWEKRSK